MESQNEKDYGFVLSGYICNNCNKETDNKEDKIDETTSHSRNYECEHYIVYMKRKKSQNKITIRLTFECKKCHKPQEKNFDIKEGNFQFECCGQKTATLYFIISLKEEENNINLNNNLIDKSQIYDNYNIHNNMNYIIKQQDLISEDDKEKNIVNNNKHFENIDVYPWPNICEENKITLIFKYYKKTNKNYHIHCSRRNYFFEVFQKFKEECQITKYKFAVCNAKILDSEKTIGELELKDKSLILIR